VGGVQVVKDCTVPGRSQATMHCKVNCKRIAELGLVEGMLGRFQLAKSLNRLKCQGEILVQCINPFTEPIKLPAGALVGKYHSIQKADVGPPLETVADASGAPPRAIRAAVPEHMADLYDGACGNCNSSAIRQALVQLLVDYTDVFSYGDEDIGLTKVVCHEIPLAAGTTPIRQPTRRLGLEKEKEVSKQVQDLLDRDLIEPAYGVWSSPVVLVTKKDNSCRFCVEYCKLNSVTVQDAYPLPRIDKSLDALAGSKYFSTLDLLSGYWQMPLGPDAQDKAAFITIDRL